MNAKKIIAIAALLSACVEAAPPARTITVKSADYGETWPLVAKEAILGCDQAAIGWIEVGGKRYALNGNALRSGLPRPDGIRKEPTLIFMADFTEKAMQLCLDQRR